MSKSRRYIFASAVFSCLLVFCFQNCTKTVFVGVESVITGNPMAPVSTKVMYAVCGVINRCHPELSIDTCESGLRNTSGFDIPLGLSSQYSTLASIIESETSGALSGNASAGANCFSSINALSCSDAQVVAAYDSSSSNPFVGAPGMVPPSSCNQVFLPGVNLEVPIELVDQGLSSNTSATVFARTRTSLSTLDYDGTVTYSFEVVALNSDSQARVISLVNSTGNTVASLTAPANLGEATRFRVAFEPSFGSNNYRLSLEGTPSAEALKVFTGRILVKQVGANKTKIYVPMSAEYFGSTRSSDDATGAVDVSNWNADYSQHSPYSFPLWKKNSAAFNQLAPTQPFTFEAVLSAKTAGTSTAYAAIFNATTNTKITDSEISTTSVAPSLVSASFADSSSGFTDQDEFEVRINGSAPGEDASIYRAGLWISLTNLKHAEVYYRYLKSAWLGMSDHNQHAFGRILLDPKAFSFPTLYVESSGYVTAANTPCTQQLFDAGESDVLLAGALVGDSAMTFDSTSKLRKRSSPVTVNSNHRYIADVLENHSAGGCILIQPRVVVGF